MIKAEDFNTVCTNNGTMKISWKLTDWCNYRCSYCITKLNGYGNIPKEDELIKQAKLLNKVVNNINGKHFKLSLIGGEIGFLDLPKLLSYIGLKNCNTITINTNFSAPKDNWLKLCKFCHKRSIRLNIHASCHLEYMNKDKFIESAIAVNNFKIENAARLTLTSKFVINNNNVIDVSNFIEKVKDYSSIALTIERTSDHEVLYNSNLQEFIDKNATKSNMYYVFDNDGNYESYSANYEALASIRISDNISGLNAYGKYCTAGIDCLRLENGKLYLSGCRHAKNLGELDPENLPDKPFICYEDRRLCSLCYGNHVFTDIDSYINNLKTINYKQINTRENWLNG